MFNLFQDPLLIISRIPALLIALTFHEYAHARTALAFGDDTAKRQGRLTLNPISHLDPVGTIMILLIGFGWARPVPINPLKFRPLKKGLIWVSFAGPLTNFVLAFISLFIYQIAFNYGFANELFIRFMGTLITLNIVLGIFNLLPIPPLDGSKILTTVLPEWALKYYMQFEPYSMIIIILLAFSGILWTIVIGPLMNIILNFYNIIITFITSFLF